MGITWKDVGEFFGCLLAFALWALIAWMFLASTPSQMSAECERQYAEMEAGR